MTGYPSARQKYLSPYALEPCTGFGNDYNVPQLEELHVVLGAKTWSKTYSRPRFVRCIMELDYI
jgi:hypothetical protein